MGDIGRDSSNNGFLCFFKLVKCIPVIIVVNLLIYSYYGYVYELCIGTVKNPVERVIYILVYHITLALLLWSYSQTVCTKTAAVPKMYRLPDEISEQFKRAPNEEGKLRAIEQYGNTLPILTRTYVNGYKTFRYCMLCSHIKPDRAHHCRLCGTCVLKMDHHCPWVNNCISYSNYKYFVLFLFYTLVFCFYIALTTLPYFLETWQGHLIGGGRIHTLFVFVIALMFCLCLLSIFCYHLYLMGYNRTTLEAFRSPIYQNGKVDRNLFDVGFLNNVKQVFGNKIILWPFPIYTSIGDGINYPVRNGDLQSTHSHANSETRRLSQYP